MRDELVRRHHASRITHHASPPVPSRLPVPYTDTILPPAGFMLHRTPDAPLTLTSGDAETTRRIGAALGRHVDAGDVILLRGELGAGKTTFTQGLVRGAGS